MSTQARPYQDTAVRSVFSKWETLRAVCLVAPTGAGKTVMAEMIVRVILSTQARVAFFAHRQELIDQTAKRFERAFPGMVGMVMADRAPEPGKPIQIASVQTCLKRSFWPAADFLILDECHHFLPGDGEKEANWTQVDAHYASAKVVGLTATPARQDGKALGIYDDLVVAAHYSELLKDGYLAACKAYQPPSITKNALAKDPLEAWRRYNPEKLTTFAFGRSVLFCLRQVEKFKAAGISAAAISYKTPKNERRYILECANEGKITVLWSDTALTEGVDVPRAKCALLARQFMHATPYLQAGGRVLRPWNNKSAIIIDLCGSTLIHGLPTEDRTYSLDGKRGIERTSVAPLKNCPRCGATILAAYQECPECDYKFQSKELRQPKIYDIELREVYLGDQTEPEKKHREWLRLLAFANLKGWGVSWALKEYHKLFADMPDMNVIGWERKLEEFRQLQAFARSRGFKPGWAGIRWKQMFGTWPPREWSSVA